MIDIELEEMQLDHSRKIAPTYEIVSRYIKYLVGCSGKMPDHGRCGPATYAGLMQDPKFLNQDAPIVVDGVPIIPDPWHEEGHIAFFPMGIALENLQFASL